MSRLYNERIERTAGRRTVRMARCMFRQNVSTYLCPDTPKLDGNFAVVTGGTSGIGEEIAKGLARRGAEVLVCSRGGKSEIQDCRTWSQETGSKIEYAKIDLGNLSNLQSQIDAIEAICSGRKFNIVVANAGIFPEKYETTDGGFESAFAVNCLGHHAFLRGLMARSLIADKARVVGTTGDIYILADNCSTNHQGSGSELYNRSKLGNIWQYREMARRYDDFETISVHPGVVASGLMGEESGPVSSILGRLLITPELGAQASLIAATQPNLGNGDYFHNTQGVMLLRNDDVAIDKNKSAAFWELLESLL